MRSVMKGEVEDYSSLRLFGSLRNLLLLAGLVSFLFTEPPCKDFEPASGYLRRKVNIE
jgi:hypothetical protein